MMFIDDTVLVATTTVGQILPHTPFKETFASLATDSTIVTTYETYMLLSDGNYLYFSIKIFILSKTL